MNLKNDGQALFIVLLLATLMLLLGMLLAVRVDETVKETENFHEYTVALNAGEGVLDLGSKEVLNRLNQQGNVHGFKFNFDDRQQTGEGRETLNYQTEKHVIKMDDGWIGLRVLPWNESDRRIFARIKLVEYYGHYFVEAFCEYPVMLDRRGVEIKGLRPPSVAHWKIRFYKLDDGTWIRIDPEEINGR